MNKTNALGTVPDLVVVRSATPWDRGVLGATTERGGTVRARYAGRCRGDAGPVPAGSPVISESVRLLWKVRAAGKRKAARRCGAIREQAQAGPGLPGQGGRGREKKEQNKNQPLLPGFRLLTSRTFQKYPFPTCPPRNTCENKARPGPPDVSLIVIRRSSMEAQLERFERFEPRIRTRGARKRSGEGHGAPDARPARQQTPRCLTVPPGSVGSHWQPIAGIQCTGPNGIQRGRKRLGASRRPRLVLGVEC